MRRGLGLGVVALAASALLAACAGGSDAAPPELAATGAWSRPTPATADEAVAYLTVRTDVADELVGASVPDSVAAAVELHQTTGSSGGGAHQHGGAADGGTVTMAQVERFELDPAEPLTFEPGGNHVMLVGLTEPLEAGDSFELTLELASGRTLEVEVPVQVNPPA